MDDLYRKNIRRRGGHYIRHGQQEFLYRIAYYAVALSQYGYNIIVVGSVLASNTPNEVYGISNGQRFLWPNGRGVTVSAPGNGECYGPNNIAFSHTSNIISTAIRDILPLSQNIRKCVKGRAFDPCRRQRLSPTCVVQ